MRSIRGGMGLGDALYVQSIARHLVNTERLQVHSAWPDVFKPLGDRVRVVPFSRNVQILAHYAPRKGREGSTQFQDCCIQAGLREPIDLRLDWVPESSLLEDRRPFVAVQLPRAPMGRKDGFGKELLPDCRVIQKIIDHLRTRFLIVQIGAGEPLFRFEGIDVDLANKTTVPGLLDVASRAAAFVGYPSFIVPLAESFNRPALIVWSHRSLKSGTLYIRQITPAKLLHKPTGRYVVDDWPKEKIRGAADALL